NDVAVGRARNSCSWISIKLPKNGIADPALALAGLRERFAGVRRQIEASARRSNRSPEEIALVAVTKTHGLETLRSALAVGITNLGENRVQEAEPKILELGRHTARWHLVGHLQANKARRAVKLFDFIHSVDSAELVRRLNRLCAEEGRA